jgi:tRNA(Ile)-lysidine synthase
MDDQAETVLLALLRGAALDGLSGMQAERPAGPEPSPGLAGMTPSPPRRPLLGLRRAETAALCASEGLAPVADPTNSDPRFRRNRVRAEVLPLLSEVAGRDLVPVLARQAALMADDARLLESLSAALDPTDARRVARAPLPLARRAIRRWLRSGDAGGDLERHPPSSAEVARVLAVAAGAVRACELAGGRRVERHAGRLRVAGKVTGS